MEFHGRITKFQLDETYDAFRDMPEDTIIELRSSDSKEGELWVARADRDGDLSEVVVDENAGRTIPALPVGA